MNTAGGSTSGGSTLPWEILKSGEPAPTPTPAPEMAPSLPAPRPPIWTELTWVFMMLVGGILSAIVWDRAQYAGGLDYCPNDASRWNTIYMLTEHGTYRYKANHGAKFREGQGHFAGVDVSGLPPEEIERRVQNQELIRVIDDGVNKYYLPTSPSNQKPGELLYLPPFATIDMVRIGENYYSSKPPLLPTILAGVVWVVEKASRDTFSENPWLMMRTTLIIVQVIPLMAFVWIVGRYVRELTTSSFVHGFCVAVAAFATYLTPWALTLNNHVIAAFCAMFAIHAVTQVWYAERKCMRLYASAGFFAAFAAVNELPAALLLAAVILALFVRSPRRTLACALVPALLPIAAFFLTNYIATGQFMPVQSKFTQRPGPYYYPGSYWNNPGVVDALDESSGFYLMNILVGHHGFFLLTPILLVSLLGMGAQLSFRSYSRPLLAFLVLAATAIVVCFYTFYTSESKNYGGAPQGPRWLFWLIPLWITMLPPGVELLSRSRVTRSILYLLLGVSAVSVGFALRQPWGTSWAHLLFRQFQWINY